MAKFNSVVWFDIYVDDMKRATAFYEQVLGGKLEKITDPTNETEMMSFPSDMESYGAAGALVKAEYARPGVGGTCIYFSVEDCAVQQAQITPAGGQREIFHR